MGAEIAQGSSRQIGSRIVRRGGLKTIVPQHLYQGEEIVVNILIDAIHL
jgi:hypothetical protein